MWPSLLWFSTGKVGTPVGRFENHDPTDGKVSSRYRRNVYKFLGPRSYGIFGPWPVEEQVKGVRRSTTSSHCPGDTPATPP